MQRKYLAQSQSGQWKTLLTETPEQELAWHGGRVVAASVVEGSVEEGEEESVVESVVCALALYPPSTTAKANQPSNTFEFISDELYGSVLRISPR